MNFRDMLVGSPCYSSLAFVFALALGAHACDDSDDKDSDNTTSASTSATGSMSESSNTTDIPALPAYVVGTRVWTEGVTTSYFHVLPALDAGTSVDVMQALEMPGPAKLYALPAIQWFALGSGEEGAITHFSLDAQSKLAAGTKLSLQAHGVSELWDALYVASPTRVYYPDGANRQLIAINPTTMTIDGAIALPETGRDGYLTVFSGSPIVRDNKLLFSVGWFDWETGDKILGETGLVTIDTINNQKLNVQVDTRCGGVNQSLTLADGHTYLVSSALAAAANRLGRLNTTPCALRVLAGTETFDAGYHVQLASLTGAALSGEAVPAGGNQIFLRAFDETLGTIKPEDQTWNITGQAAWKWLRWDVTTNQIATVNQLQPGTADVLWFKVEDRVYGSQTKEDYSETTLIELTAAGGPRPALTVPGFLHAVAKVR